MYYIIKNLPSMDPSYALIIVDVQKDFCPGGSLAVAKGDEIVPIINSLQEQFFTVIFTQDWHPVDHVSFASNNEADLFTLQEVTLPDGTPTKQIMWPDHCVQESTGADFHSDLHMSKDSKIVQKGTHKLVDSYSGFGDALDGKYETTPLDLLLKEKGITTVYVVGLAFDYCVGFTALDAQKKGYKTYIIEDATRSVSEESFIVMKKQLEEAGVTLFPSSGLIV